MQIRSWAALAALALTPAIAQAQHALPIEFGVDAGVSFTTGDPKTTSIDIPVQALRVGFYVTEQVAIEPALAFNYTKFDNSSSNVLQTELGLVYDFTVDRKAPQFYFRPFAGLSRVSFDVTGQDNASETLWNAGVGLGVKIPFKSAERFAWRFEALYDHSFEKADVAPAENAFGLKLGLSFFTK